MRAPIPTIRESVDELHERLLAEKRKRLKVRIMALWMLKSGQSTTREAVAEALGVHRHTITRWLAKYRRGGLDELLTIRTRPNRKRVVPDRVMLALETELRAKPEQFASFKDVQAWLLDRYGLDVKYKTIYRLVRYELGIHIGSIDRPMPSRQDSDKESLASIFRNAARFINDNNASPNEVSAAVQVLASMVKPGEKPGSSTEARPTDVSAEPVDELRRLADDLDRSVGRASEARIDRPAAEPQRPTRHSRDEANPKL
jgi:transposase